MVGIGPAPGYLCPSYTTVHDVYDLLGVTFAGPRRCLEIRNFCFDQLFSPFCFGVDLRGGRFGMFVLVHLSPWGSLNKIDHFCPCGGPCFIPGVLFFLPSPLPPFFCGTALCEGCLISVCLGTFTPAGAIFH